MTVINPIVTGPEITLKTIKNKEEAGKGFSFLIFLMAKALDAKDEATSGPKSAQDLLIKDIEEKRAIVEALEKEIKGRIEKGITDSDGMTKMTALMNEAQGAEAELERQTSQLGNFWQFNIDPAAKEFYAEVLEAAHVVGKNTSVNMS